MVSKKLIVITIGLSLIFGFSMYTYLLSETSLFYGQSTIEPIKIYWKVNVETVYVNPALRYSFIPDSSLPNYTISNIDFEVNDPIKSSNTRFLITCQNFSNNVDFLYPVQGGFVGNFTKVQEYEIANQPDLLVKTSLAQTGEILAWSQVWNNPISLNSISPKSNPLLKQVGFNTWECKYLFDGSPSTIEHNNENFTIAPVASLSFHVTIPSKYEIQNPEEFSTSMDSSGSFHISKDIRSGETFHLTMTDSNLESTRIWLSAFSYVGFASIIASIIVGIIVERIQRK